MADGVGIGYDSDGLRRGGAQASVAGETAAGAAGMLRGLEVSVTAFGVVTGAAALAAGLAVARDRYALMGVTIAHDHGVLVARVGSVAGDADRMTADTSEHARYGDSPARPR